jgi:hypothetical protein
MIDDLRNYAMGPISIQTWKHERGPNRYRDAAVVYLGGSYTSVWSGEVAARGRSRKLGAHDRCQAESTRCTYPYKPRSTSVGQMDTTMPQ